MTYKKNNTNFKIQLNLFINITINKPNILNINTNLLHYTIYLH